MQRLLILSLVVGACGGSGSSSTDGGGTSDSASSDGATNDAPPSDGVPEDSMISPCPAGTWCVEDPPNGVTQLIHAIDAVDQNDVFAVGDGGTILRRQNGAWTKMTSNTTRNLRGVWAYSSANVWAAGDEGTIVHWDGAAWTMMTAAPNYDYNCLWGAGPNDVWFAAGAVAIHWTGTFSSDVPITGTPVAMSGTASNDIWIAAENGKLSHYTSSWALVTTVAPNNFFAVYARAAGDVWASTPGMGTLRYNGATWTAYGTGATLFAGIYAPAADNAWGVGNTKVGHWNGVEWTVATPVNDLTSSLYGVTGVGPHTWAVGANATILYHHD